MNSDTSELEVIDCFHIRLDSLNHCSLEAAFHQFRSCCGSSTWARQMAGARPFHGIAETEAAADEIWAACSRQDWLEAFAAHPRIGKQSQSRWSQQEQSGVACDTPSIYAAFAEANRKYESRFGYIFVVSATGKATEEILQNLLQRLRNDPATEVQIAVEQQRLITRLRLRKLLSE